MAILARPLKGEHIAITDLQKTVCGQCVSVGLWVCQGGFGASRGGLTCPFVLNMVFDLYGSEGGNENRPFRSKVKVKSDLLRTGL